jgi:hypothetical protein
MNSNASASDTESAALPTVYIETSVVSYLTARLSRNVEVLGHQITTRRWWQRSRRRFRLVTSELTIGEAAKGDPIWAAKRLKRLQSAQLIAITNEAIDFAAKLVAERILPLNAGNDALHLAAVVINGVNYLLTWNCGHLANANTRRRVEEYCRSCGFVPPVICTPGELMNP